MIYSFYQDPGGNDFALYFGSARRLHSVWVRDTSFEIEDDSRNYNVKCVVDTWDIRELRTDKVLNER
jgi:hypothetical protein